MLVNATKIFIKRIITRNLTSRVGYESSVEVNPISEVFGLDRGTPLDRVFIEHFLQKNQKKIKGICLEVEDSKYTKKYGQAGCIAHELKLNPSSSRVNNLELVADLTKPETIPENKFDTFICTQTLNFIFDLEPVIISIHKLLKKGGYALITVAGISQISRYDHERWGDFWRFTDKSLRKLINNRFDDRCCLIETYGNVATSCLFLQGIAYEDIKDTHILWTIDNNYQMVISAIVMK